MYEQHQKLIKLGKEQKSAVDSFKTLNKEFAVHKKEMDGLEQDVRRFEEKKQLTSRVCFSPFLLISSLLVQQEDLALVCFFLSVFSFRQLELLEKARPWIVYRDLSRQEATYDKAVEEAEREFKEKQDQLGPAQQLLRYVSIVSSWSSSFWPFPLVPSASPPDPFFLSSEAQNAEKKQTAEVKQLEAAFNRLEGKRADIIKQVVCTIRGDHSMVLFLIHFRPSLHQDVGAEAKEQELQKIEEEARQRAADIKRIQESIAGLQRQLERMHPEAELKQIMVRWFPSCSIFAVLFH